MASLTFLICFLSLFSWVGCVGKAPIRGPAAAAPETHEKSVLSHLVGTWELPSKNGVAAKQMIFAPDGQLTFRGGLEFYNPARWRLDVERRELTMILPNAPDEKLDIFHMYVGDGVKAFDRKQKEVTYDFDEQTWSLNVAGWTYSKLDKPTAAPLEEPVLK